MCTSCRKFTESPLFTRCVSRMAGPVPLPGYLEARQTVLGMRNWSPVGPPVAPIAARCTPYPVGQLSAMYPRLPGILPSRTAPGARKDRRRPRPED